MNGQDDEEEESEPTVLHEVWTPVLHRRSAQEHSGQGGWPSQEHRCPGPPAPAPTTAPYSAAAPAAGGASGEAPGGTGNSTTLHKDLSSWVPSHRIHHLSSSSHTPGDLPLVAVFLCVLMCSWGCGTCVHRREGHVSLAGYGRAQ